MLYKTVYKLENGVLIQNKDNKIEYTCPDGVKRTKTNPTLKDFAERGYYPVNVVGDIPNYDIFKEELKEHIELKDGCWEKSYVAVSRQPSADREGEE